MKVDYSPILDAVRSQIADALPILVGIAAFVIALKWLETRFSRRNRRRWRSHGRRKWQSRRDNVSPFQPRHAPEVGKMQSAADQLRTVMQADFRARPLLNKSEARLFRAMDKLVIELAPPGWQVMAQVSLGEILSSKDQDAYLCINSKRVDLLDGLNVAFQVEKGQVLCHSFTESYISMKFDDGPIQKFRCTGSSDGSTETAFIEDEGRALAALKRSKRAVVEAEFFQQGRQQFVFETAGLRWK